MVLAGESVTAVGSFDHSASEAFCRSFFAFLCKQDVENVSDFSTPKSFMDEVI